MKPEENIRHLLRPWMDGWQLWKTSGDNSSWEYVAQQASPSDPQPPPGPLDLVLPARKIAAWAGWIPSDDPELCRESASMLIEVAGLSSPSTPPESRQIRLIRKEGDRSLVRACVFPPDFAVPPAADWKHFFPSPEALPPTPESLTIYPEPDSVVAVLTGNNGPVLWEATAGIPDATALRAWLGILLLEARASEISPPLRRIVDWTGLLGEDSLAGIPVEPPPLGTPNGPPPMCPESEFTWTPPGVLAHRASVTRKQNLVRILTAAGAFVLAVVLVATGVLIHAKWQTMSLRAEVQRLERETAEIIRAAREWEILGPSVDPSRFALERLLMAVNALPGDGVRLSIFEATPSGIRIEGDARNVGLATLYFNSLRAEPGAEQFLWEMPPPALQPDNTARFAVNGSPLP